MTNVNVEKLRLWQKFKRDAQSYTAIASAVMAIATFVLAYYTYRMASSTKQLADLYKTPKFNIHFAIKCNFGLIKDNTIAFKAGDYLKDEKNAEFFIKIENTGPRRIYDNISIRFVVYVLKDNQIEQERVYNFKDQIDLNSNEMTELKKVPDLQQILLKQELDWPSIDTDMIIKIEIDKRKVFLDQNPRPFVEPIYDKYKFIKNK